MLKTQKSTQRLRILMLADDCNPEWHSLPALVYNYICEVSQYADVVVVTHIRNQPNIEAAGIGNAKVVYLNTEKVAAPLYKLAAFLSGDPNTAMTLKVAMGYPSYLAFEWAVWKRFRKELKNGEFDIIHRVSPMSPTIPSPIAKWSSVPFVIGPINGGLKWPKQCTNELLREREWMTFIRDAHRWMPFYKSTYSRAAAILASYQHTMEDLPASAKPRIFNFPEGGVDPAVFTMPTREKKEKMTVLFVGRLVPFKMPEVLVRSFAASPILRQHRLVFVGDGPERSRLEEIVQKEGLADCVEFTGTISQLEVGKLMRESEIFGFPSIREQGGGVLTLAMMSGMACVAVNYGGPATRVAPGCGVRVPLGDVNELTRSYTQELEALVQDPERVAQLGEAGRNFTVTHYNWNVKAQKTVEIYNWIVGQSAEKPDFWAKSSSSTPEVAEELSVIPAQVDVQKSVSLTGCK